MRIHRKRKRSHGGRDNECPDGHNGFDIPPRKQQRVCDAFGREYARVERTMGEYVVEYIYRFVMHTTIPSDIRDAVIQFRNQMERMVVGGELWNDDNIIYNKRTIRVDMVLHRPTRACWMVGRVELLDFTTDFDRTGRVRRAGMERRRMAGVWVRPQ